MIVLVGFMGAGKTTVGRLVARSLGLPFVDVDERVAAAHGRSIAQIFETRGERFFRLAEREEAVRALDGEDAVVALGGGALDDILTRAAIRHGIVVHLTVELDEARRRIGPAGDRPMLARVDPSDLFERRRAAYEWWSNVSIPTDGLSPDDVAARVVAAVQEVEPVGPARDRGTYRINVATSARDYGVIVGGGAVARVGDVGAASRGDRAFVISHRSLDAADIVRTTLVDAGIDAHLLEIGVGEVVKSLETVGDLYRRLAALEAHRDEPIFAVGGGVVTDVAGFVASTFNRGMPLVNVPTTLLGQVDAAIGGKTGVNLPEGKNLVGTFYQPAAVVCDISLLGSLPEAELRSGLAEVVKYGLIGDVPLARFVESNASALVAGDGAALKHVVARSVADKAAIVEADEREGGVRVYLNYGHTFAHAIEWSDSYGGRHGEAVAVGMMAAAHLAHVLGMVNDACVDLHRRILQAAGLPTSARLSLDELEKAWKHDKKFRNGVRFVLLDQEDVPPDLKAEGFALPGRGARPPRDALIETLDRLAR